MEKIRITLFSSHSEYRCEQRSENEVSVFPFLAAWQSPILGVLQLKPKAIFLSFGIAMVCSKILSEPKSRRLFRVKRSECLNSRKRIKPSNSPSRVV